MRAGPRRAENEFPFGARRECPSGVNVGVRPRSNFLKGIAAWEAQEPDPGGDSVVVESFFATLKRELVYRRSWPTKDEAIASLDEWIDFYNRERRHSFLGFRSPEEYEQTYVVSKRASAA